MQEIARQAGAACAAIGEVGGTALRIAVNGAPLIEREVSELEAVWRDALSAHLDQPQAQSA